MRIALLLTMLISYGSLYPFAFEFDSQLSLIQPLLNAPVWTGILDCIANILLFMPLAMWLRARQHGSVRRVLIVTILLALDLQLLQVYLPSREPALMDVVWNSVGVLLSLALLRVDAIFLAIQQLELRFPRQHSAFALLSIWVVAQLFPFLPDMNWLHWQQNWDRLESSKLLSFSHLLMQFFAGLMVLELFRSMAWRLRYAVLLMLVVLLLRSWFVEIGLDWPRLLAWPCAMACAAVWYGLPNSLRWRSLLLGLGLGYIATSLAPMLLRSEPLTIDWLPLHWLFSDPSASQQAPQIARVPALQQLLQRLFVLASIAYLWRRVGVSHWICVIAVGLLAFITELAQRNIVWQMPNSDEVVLWLMLAVGWLFWQGHIPSAKDWDKPKQWRALLRSKAALFQRHGLLASFHKMSVFATAPVVGRAWNMELGLAIAVWTCLSLLVANIPSIATSSQAQYWLNAPAGGSFALLFALLVFAIASLHWFVARPAAWNVQFVRALTAALTTSLFALVVFHAALRPVALIELLGVPSLLALQQAAAWQLGGLVLIDLPAVLLGAWRCGQLFLCSFAGFTAVWLLQLAALNWRAGGRGAATA